MQSHWELTFFRLESALTADTVGPLRDELAALLARPGHVVMDLRGTTVDSTGLGTVLGMQHRLGLAGRRLLVVANDPQFADLAERAGARNALAVFADAEAALRHAASLHRPEPPC
jgi:anti-anti-sigma regulatory factor